MTATAPLAATDDQIRALYERVARIRREMAWPDDHWQVCRFIADLGDVPLMRVHDVCAECGE